jgi:hypothetical protein
VNIFGYRKDPVMRYVAESGCLEAAKITGAAEGFKGLGAAAGNVPYRLAQYQYGMSFLNFR